MCNIRSLFKYTIIAAAVALFLSFSSCKDEPVKPPEDPEVSISVEDVSCIEAWLSIKADNAEELKLFRGDSLIRKFNILPVDTLIMDEGLMPNQSYLYKAEVLFNNKTLSKEASARTMDTTTHNYTWQSWEFGDYTTNVLYDVAIIDENNIWAVGAVYMNDSLGNWDTDAYNVVHWNGEKWEIKRIYYYGACSGVIYPPLQAIWVFSANNIILTNGGSIGWYDGNTIRLDCRMNPLLDGAINSIWASSSSNVYLVGNNGTIVHYDGSNWKKIESGTDLNLTDVYGAYDKTTGEYEILTTASSLGQSLDKALIKIEGDNAFRISIEPVLSTLGSVWFIPERKYYLVGGRGVYEKNSLKDSLWKERPAVVYNYPHVVRGNNFNNVFIAGSFGDLAHFNGVKWKNLKNEINLPNSVLASISIKGNLVLLSGFSGRKGIIIKGTRN